MTIGDFFLKLISIGKISTKKVFLFCIVSVSLLYLPQNIIQNLRLESFLKNYGTYIGLISLATASFLIIEFFLWFFHLIKSKYEESKAKKTIINNINNLDIHEKSFLREFYIQEKNTIHLPIENPVVAGLIYNGS